MVFFPAKEKRRDTALWQSYITTIIWSILAKKKKKIKKIERNVKDHTLSLAGSCEVQLLHHVQVFF